MGHAIPSEDEDSGYWITPQVDRDSKYQSLSGKIFLYKWFLVRVVDKNPRKRMKRNVRQVAVGGYTTSELHTKIQTAPIETRVEKCLLRTTDGIDVKLFGLIDQQQTYENGFSFKIINFFYSGFPFNWSHLINLHPEKNSLAWSHLIDSHCVENCLAGCSTAKRREHNENGMDPSRFQSQKLDAVIENIEIGSFQRHEKLAKVVYPRGLKRHFVDDFEPDDTNKICKRSKLVPEETHSILMSQSKHQNISCNEYDGKLNCNSPRESLRMFTAIQNLSDVPKGKSVLKEKESSEIGDVRRKRFEKTVKSGNDHESSLPSDTPTFSDDSWRPDSISNNVIAGFLGAKARDHNDNDQITRFESQKWDAIRENIEICSSREQENSPKVLCPKSSVEGLRSNFTEGFGPCCNIIKSSKHCKLVSEATRSTLVTSPSKKQNTNHKKYDGNLISDDVVMPESVSNGGITGVSIAKVRDCNENDKNPMESEPQELNVVRENTKIGSVKTQENLANMFCPKPSVEGLKSHFIEGVKSSGTNTKSSKHCKLISEAKHSTLMTSPSKQQNLSHKKCSGNLNSDSPCESHKPSSAIQDWKSSEFSKEKNVLEDKEGSEVGDRRQKRFEENLKCAKDNENSFHGDDSTVSGDVMQMDSICANEVDHDANEGNRKTAILPPSTDKQKSPSNHPSTKLRTHKRDRHKKIALGKRQAHKGKKSCKLISESTHSTLFRSPSKQQNLNHKEYDSNLNCNSLGEGVRPSSAAQDCKFSEFSKEKNVLEEIKSSDIGNARQKRFEVKLTSENGHETYFHLDDSVLSDDFMEMTSVCANGGDRNANEGDGKMFRLSSNVGKQTSASNHASAEQRIHKGRHRHKPTTLDKKKKHKGKTSCNNSSSTPLESSKKNESDCESSVCDDDTTNEATLLGSIINNQLNSDVIQDHNPQSSELPCFSSDDKHASDCTRDVRTVGNKSCSDRGMKDKVSESINGSTYTCSTPSGPPKGEALKDPNVDTNRKGLEPSQTPNTVSARKSVHTPKHLIPPLLSKRVETTTEEVSKAFGLKTSKSGRLIVPPLAHWLNQKIAYDMDGGIIAVFDGSSQKKAKESYLFSSPKQADAIEIQKKLYDRLNVASLELRQSPKSARKPMKGGCHSRFQQ